MLNKGHHEDVGGREKNFRSEEKGFYVGEGSSFKTAVFNMMAMSTGRLQKVLKGLQKDYRREAAYTP